MLKDVKAFNVLKLLTLCDPVAKRKHFACIFIVSGWGIVVCYAIV